MALFPRDLLEASEALLARCRQDGLKIATAESCTGGLVAGLLTEIPGSSDVVDRGFVTYSNAAKIAQLGVPAALIKEFGAVSREVAIAMAEGALDYSEAQLAVSVTGVAGPGGGSPDKPVGLVQFAVARRGFATVNDKQLFSELDRHAIRIASVRNALLLLTKAANQPG